MMNMYQQIDQCKASKETINLSKKISNLLTLTPKSIRSKDGHIIFDYGHSIAIDVISPLVFFQDKKTKYKVDKIDRLQNALRRVT